MVMNMRMGTAAAYWVEVFFFSVVCIFMCLLLYFDLE